MTPAADRFHLWVRDEASARAAFLRGERVDVGLTAYGQQDFVVEFLMGSGLWEVMSSVRPDGLRKENGKPWRALNGVEVLREVLRVDNVARVGRILRDVRLMHLAGFNAQAVRRAVSRGTPVIDPETLSNHLARISPRSMERSFTEHVRLMRRKGWLRPGAYAVDGHVISIPHGRRSEKAGVVGETRGYMLLAIVGPVPQARVVGWMLAPLGHSEKAMLRVLLKRMARTVGPLSRWMKVLLLDRGYWGARYLRDLAARHHISYVTMARDGDLKAVEDADDALLEPSTAWKEREEAHEHLGRIHVRAAGVEGVGVATDGRGGHPTPMNFVAAEESDAKNEPLREKDGTPRGRIHYATNKPTRKDPLGIRSLYQSRWTVENQGFRTLTQRFGLDLRVGRKFPAICARIGFVIMLHNAMSVLRHEYPGPWEDEKRRLGDQGGVGPMMGGPQVAALTAGGAMGLWTTAEYEGLVEKRQLTKLQEAAKAALCEGRDAKQVLSDLLGLPPGKN